MDVMQTKQGWAVVINTDLTEGRGGVYASKVCTSKTTANRLAKKADVQGTDGLVVPVELVMVDRGVRDGLAKHCWYGPIRLILPSREDEEADKALEAERIRLHKMAEVEAKALSLGLSEDELAVLTGKK